MEQNNQVQKPEQPTFVEVYKPNLKAALQKGDKISVQSILKSFKTDQGGINYPAIFSIPTDERIFILAKNDFPGTLTIIAAGVTLAMEALNLRTPMTALQIIDLSDAIIDTAGEDNLALEDLMLFLQNLTRGKYNPLYESMDVAKFMEKFEIYRQERHEAIAEYRENKHLELTALGNANRTSKPASALDEHLAEFNIKIQTMKDELHLKNRELKESRK